MSLLHLSKSLRDRGVTEECITDYVNFITEQGLGMIYDDRNLSEIFFNNLWNAPRRMRNIAFIENKLVFHGTNLESAIAIREQGVDLSKTSPCGDFNVKKGFYVTPDLFYAARASQKYLFPHLEGKLAVVVFELLPRAPITYLESARWTRAIKENRHGISQPEVDPETEPDQNTTQPPKSDEILVGLNCKNPQGVVIGERPIPGNILQMCFRSEESLDFLVYKTIIPFQNTLPGC